MIIIWYSNLKVQIISVEIMIISVIYTGVHQFITTDYPFYSTSQSTLLLKSTFRNGSYTWLCEPLQKSHSSLHFYYTTETIFEFSTYNPILKPFDNPKPFTWSNSLQCKLLPGALCFHCFFSELILQNYSLKDYQKFKKGTVKPAYKNLVI